MDSPSFGRAGFHLCPRRDLFEEFCSRGRKQRGWERGGRKEGRKTFLTLAFERKGSRRRKGSRQGGREIGNKPIGKEDIGEEVMRLRREELGREQ